VYHGSARGTTIVGARCGTCPPSCAPPPVWSHGRDRWL
jgi:hypothetical protein